MVPLDSFVLCTSGRTSERRQSIMRKTDNFAMTIKIDSTIVVVLDRIGNRHKKRSLGVHSTMQVEDLF